MIDLAVAKNIIQKAGAWFAYGDERLGQGRENAKELLEQNAALAAKIEKEVIAAYNVKPVDDKAKPAEAAKAAVVEPAKAVVNGERVGAEAGKPVPPPAAKAAPQAIHAAEKKKPAPTASK
jgi:recombination protein RecA